MTAAERPLPTEAKRALRPSRSPIAACPTRPRLMAASAGPSTQLDAAWSTLVATTMMKIGQRPLLGRQIDRDERAKTGLNVCHEESEPIEPAKAGARRSRRLVFRLRA